MKRGTCAACISQTCFYTVYVKPNLLTEDAAAIRAIKTVVTYVHAVVSTGDTIGPAA